MLFLRLIDIDGKEHYVVDVGQLYELIKAGKVNYECLVRDDSLEQWVLAREHPYFIKIRGLASQSELAAPSHLVSSQDMPTKLSQIEDKTHELRRQKVVTIFWLQASVSIFSLSSCLWWH